MQYRYILSTAKGPPAVNFPIQHCNFLYFSLHAVPITRKNITVFREKKIVAGATGCVICKLSAVDVFKCQTVTYWIDRLHHKPQRVSEACCQTLKISLSVIGLMIIAMLIGQSSVCVRCRPWPGVPGDVERRLWIVPVQSSDKHVICCSIWHWWRQVSLSGQWVTVVSLRHLSASKPALVL